MVNNTQLLSVSVPKALVSFIEEAELSPSAIIQDAIIEKKQLWDKIHSDVEKVTKAKEVLQSLVLELTTFIEEKGIKYDDFLKWRGEFIRHQNVSNVIL